jgi:putative zinc ribbon protein
MPQDETINCVDCKADFVFSAGEQTFFKSKGLTNKPKRCAPCRKKKKDRNVQPVRPSDVPYREGVDGPAYGED